MRSTINKLFDSNAATIFMFLYGIIIQIVALPAIYYYGLAYQEAAAMFERLVIIWFCIPTVSVIAILIAVLQIIKRNNKEKWKVSLIGLILNFLWFSAYLVTLYLVFVEKDFSFLL